MNGAAFVLLWAKAFALTLSVELGVAAPLLARTEPVRWRRAAVVTIAQFATHPIVWFVLPELRLPRVTFLVVAEAWAILGEAAVYRTALPASDFRRMLLVSGAANAASFAAGYVLRSLGAW